MAWSEEARKNHEAAIRRRQESPEYPKLLKKLSASQRQAWKNPERKRKHHQGMKKAWRNDVFCKQYDQRLYHDKDWLAEQYLIEHRTMADIGTECGVSATAIHKWLIKYDIPTRSMSEAWKYRGPCSQATRQKISETSTRAWQREERRQQHITQMREQWQAGIFGPLISDEEREYPLEFNDEFKAAIRSRDNDTCAICRLPGRNVHHIDYDKKSTVPDNCITLCNSCHGVTHWKRPYWKSALSALVQIREYKNA